MWSFAVLGWEVLTLGDIPYFEITDDQKVVAFVTGGGRLSREKMACECPDALWSLLQRCWSRKTRDRPTFSSLVIELQTHRDRAAELKTAARMARAAREAGLEGGREEGRARAPVAQAASAKVSSSLAAEDVGRKTLILGSAVLEEPVHAVCVCVCVCVRAWVHRRTRPLGHTAQTPVRRSRA